jgi:antibiotic biosynthesis monooxygenase (ABM) superfamily enzyme
MIKMTIYLCRTYIVKPGKLKEHNKWGKKLVILMKKKPSLFNGVKSLQVFSHDGSKDKFTAMWSFEGSLDIKGWENGFSEIPEEKALREEFMKLIEPNSILVQVLKPIKIMKRNLKTQNSKK